MAAKCFLLYNFSLFCCCCCVYNDDGGMWIMIYTVLQWLCHVNIKEHNVMFLCLLCCLSRRLLSCCVCAWRACVCSVCVCECEFYSRGLAARQRSRRSSSRAHTWPRTYSSCIMLCLQFGLSYRNVDPLVHFRLSLQFLIASPLYFRFLF